jgi:hypothetical protein
VPLCQAGHHDRRAGHVATSQVAWSTYFCQSVPDRIAVGHIRAPGSHAYHPGHTSRSIQQPQNALNVETARPALTFEQTLAAPTTPPRNVQRYPAHGARVCRKTNASSLLSMSKKTLSNKLSSSDTSSTAITSQNCRAGSVDMHRSSHSSAFRTGTYPPGPLSLRPQAQAHPLVTQRRPARTSAEALFHATANPSPGAVPQRDEPCPTPYAMGKINRHSAAANYSSNMSPHHQFFDAAKTRATSSSNARHAIRPRHRASQPKNGHLCPRDDI